MTPELKPYPNYKESELPWTGEIPIHWNLQRLDRLFTLRKETPHIDDQRVTGYLDGRVTLRSNVKGQKIKGVIFDSNWQRIYPGDFAISGMNAHIGGIGVSDSLGKCSPIYLVLKPHEGTNARFVSLAVRHIAFAGGIKTLVNTIRFNSADFKRDGLKKILVWLPTNEEQVKIVSFISHFDSRITRLTRLKRKLIALLNEQKQAIIQQAVTRGLDPGVRLKPSGVEWLGDIPEHWELIKIGQLALSLQTGPFGSQLHNQDYVENGIPIINPSHMVDGVVVPSEKNAISREKWEELKRHAVEIDDVIFARRGQLGRCALITDKEEGWLCGTGSIRLRPNNKYITGRYLTLLMRLTTIGEVLTLESVGATMDNLNPARLAKLQLPIPPLDEQSRIIEYTDKATKQIEKYLNESNIYLALIREYRTRLIADVVTGKLDVRGVELPEIETIEDEETFDEAGDLPEDELEVEIHGQDGYE